jgi:hypothetical protein
MFECLELKNYCSDCGTSTCSGIGASRRGSHFLKLLLLFVKFWDFLVWCGDLELEGGVTRRVFNDFIDDFTKSDLKSFCDDFEIFKILLKYGDLI